MNIKIDKYINIHLILEEQLFLRVVNEMVSCSWVWVVFSKISVFSKLYCGITLFHYSFVWFIRVLYFCSCFIYTENEYSANKSGLLCIYFGSMAFLITKYFISTLHLALWLPVNFGGM